MKRIILIGPTCAGKDYIKTTFKNKGFNIDCSYTTRPIRNTEINHRDYHFITEELFMTMAFEGKLHEFIRYGDHLYGTGKNEWETSDIFIMETDGVKSLKPIDRENSIIICITAPVEERIERMYSRGWDIKKINERLKIDEERFKDIESYVDLVLVNSTKK